MNGIDLKAGLTNTWQLIADTLYFVDYPPAGSCNIRNIGSAPVWIRLDGQDAAIDDVKSLMIPADGVSLDIPFHGPISIHTGNGNTTLVMRCW